MFRKVRTIIANYIPDSWGVKVDGDKTIAWISFKRTNPDKVYAFYGDDADCYKEFEEDGFVVSSEVADFEEADKWIKDNVFQKIGE